MSRARCYGPAGDMSLTSGGYVLRTEGGTWVRSTVVMEPRDWQALQEQRDAEAEAEDRAREPDAPRGHSLRQGLSQAPSPEVPLPRAAGDGGQVADTGEEEQASLEESRPLFQVIPHDLPRRRVHGKSPPISQAAPSLRSLREAGEQELLVEEALQGADREDLQRDAEAEHEVVVKQHRELKELMQEDEIRMREGMLCKAEIETVMKVVEEVKALEAKLWYENNVKMRKLEADAELEVLQTRTVPLEEIRRDLQGWTEAFRKEVDMLMAGPVSRITKQEYQQLCSQGIPMETLPTKMVATVKIVGRRKGRIVVCGNFASEKASDTSIGGVCAVAFRRRGVRPEKSQWFNHLHCWSKWAWQSMERCGESNVESPSDWGHFRDTEGLMKMEWEENGITFRLVPSGEPHLWKIRAQGKTHGVVLVYVDDFPWWLGALRCETRL